MIRLNSIAGRFHTLIVLAVLAVAGVAGLSTYQLTASNRAHRTETLRSLTDTALSSVGHFANLAKSGTLDEETAKRDALAALSSMRYDGQENGQDRYTPVDAMPFEEMLRIAGSLEPVE